MISPIGSVSTAPVSAALGALATRAVTQPRFDGLTDGSALLQTVARLQPSTDVSLSGIGQVSAALSGLQDAARAAQTSPQTALSRESLLTLVAAFNRLNDVTLSVLSNDSDDDEVAIVPLSGPITEALLRSGSVSDPAGELARIGLSLDASGGIRLDSTTLTQAFQNDPGRVLGLIGEAANRIDAFTVAQLDALSPTAAGGASVNGLFDALSRSLSAAQAQAGLLASNFSPAAGLATPANRAIAAFLEVAGL